MQARERGRPDLEQQYKGEWYIITGSGNTRYITTSLTSDIFKSWMMEHPQELLPLYGFRPVPVLAGVDVFRIFILVAAVDAHRARDNPPLSMRFRILNPAAVVHNAPCTACHPVLVTPLVYMLYYLCKHYATLSPTP